MQILPNHLDCEVRIRVRERGEELSRKHLDVLDILLLADGSSSSPVKTIAAKAGCARSTVYEALKTLEAAGILTIERCRGTSWAISFGEG